MSWWSLSTSTTRRGVNNKCMALPPRVWAHAFMRIGRGASTEKLVRTSAEKKRSTLKIKSSKPHDSRSDPSHHRCGVQYRKQRVY